MSAQPSSSTGRDWSAFVIVMFFILGCFNLIEGLGALMTDDYFRADELLFGDLSMWGALYLGVGALQLFTAWLIYRGSEVGALLGIVLASLNAVVALFSVGAYPVWSVIILIFDGLVIYALTVYGPALSTTD